MKALLIFFFFLLSIRLLAPGYLSGVILKAEPVKPYERIFKVICQIESNNDSLAVNLNDPNGGSFGIAQIGWLKLSEYNQATGANYKLTDLFSVELSKKIFLWHCMNYPDIETACKRWNGSGSATLVYWDKITAYLF